MKSRSLDISRLPTEPFGFHPGAQRSLSWEGLLQIVDIDTGAGTFTGGVPGQTTFQGFFLHPGSCDVDCVVDSFEGGTSYRFGGASGASGGVQGVGASAQPFETRIDIVDDLDPVAAEVQQIFEALGLPIEQGQVFDGWLLGSRSAPEGTPGAVEWAVIYVYVNSDPFTGTEFVADPPPMPDLVAFQVAEAGSQANTYQVFGTVTEAPEPCTAAMLAAGVLTLTGLARRRRGIVQPTP